jgi:hypothetical protein
LKEADSHGARCAIALNFDAAKSEVTEILENRSWHIS